MAAKMAIDFPINLEKINPKSGPSRRFSTGNGIIKISEPLPIPNYLRASIGSCHDFCKYGATRDVAPESVSTKRGKMVNNKALGRRKSLPVPSSRQQPSESKSKPLVRSDQSSLKQHNKPLLKSTKNVQTRQDHAGKGTISLPRSSSKESIFRRSGKNASSPEKDTRFEIKKFVENEETCQNSSSSKEFLSQVADKSSLEKDSHLENKKLVENSDTCQNTSSGKETLFRRADKSSPEKDSDLEIKKSIENSETCHNTSSCKESIFQGADESSLEKDSRLEIKTSVENLEIFQNTSSGKESIFQGADESSLEKDPVLEIKTSVENSEIFQNTSSDKESIFQGADESSLEKDSRLEIKTSVENSETCQKTSYEDIPEKIIHVVEPIDDVKRDEDLTPNGSQCRGLVSSPNHKQKLDSEAKESDSSSRKLKFTKNGQALEIENIEGDFKGSLRRVVLEGETTDPEENVTMRVTLRRKAITQKTKNSELMNVVIEETAHKVCNKNKVKALVSAFESLITIQDSECPSPSTRSV